MSFMYWGELLEYCTHPFNDSRQNERAVEIPIAQQFLDRATGNGFELGNVLSNYGPTDHWVVDRYDPAAHNLDVFDITGRFDWILAVSTLEHVRWDEEPKTAHGAGQALHHLLGLRNPGGKLLVTVPFGWHPFLDTQILDGEFSPVRECSFIRIGDGWVQGPVEHRRYAATTIWAESIWVAEW